MGYIKHDAVIVTGYHLEKLHSLAKTIFQDTPAFVTDISPEAVNGWTTFAIFPDGSKEGWPDSQDADTARQFFISRLEKHNQACHESDDGGYPADYVQVRFGGDDHHTTVEAKTWMGELYWQDQFELEKELGMWPSKGNAPSS